MIILVLLIIFYTSLDKIYKSLSNIILTNKPGGHFEVIGELNENNFSKNTIAKGYLMSDGKVLITNGIDYSILDINKKEIKKKNKIEIKADSCSTQGFDSLKTIKLKDDKILSNWLDKEKHKTCSLIYDYKNNSYKKIKGMNVYRTFYSAILLENGNVLIIGGLGDYKDIDKKYHPNTAEIFNYKKEVFELGGKSKKERNSSPILLELPNKNILVVQDSSTNIKMYNKNTKKIEDNFNGYQEIYDISKNQFIEVENSKYLPSHNSLYTKLQNGNYVFWNNHYTKKKVTGRKKLNKTLYKKTKNSLTLFDGTQYSLLSEIKTEREYSTILNYNQDKIMFLGNKFLNYNNDTLIYDFKNNVFEIGPNLNYGIWSTSNIIKLNEDNFLVLNGCYQVDSNGLSCKKDFKNPIEIFVKD